MVFSVSFSIRFSFYIYQYIYFFIDYDLLAPQQPFNHNPAPPPLKTQPGGFEKSIPPSGVPTTSKVIIF